jgi:glutathione S-transferase
MLKLYGDVGSRARRSMWMCRELGLQYEHIPLHFADGSTKKPEYLALNPNGKIPAIDDDGFVLWESLAINIYLAKKHRSPLMPQDLQGEAQVLQWSLWVVTEVEKPLLQALLQRMELPADNPGAKYLRDRNPKDPAVEKQAIETLEKPLSVLNGHLAQREYLLGPTFTVADLNVASVMGWAIRAKLDLSTKPNVEQWLQRCVSRPAAKG